jgi:DNA topoisomerase VI subunit A
MSEEKNEQTLPVWNISGVDKRQKILDSTDTFLSQSTGGQDVEYFSPETGFVLLKKDKAYNINNTNFQRVKSLCELSLSNPTMGLRESYYTIRQTARLIQPFRSTTNIYQAVLQSINDMEIMADVERDVFVEGKNPKGIIFYPFNPTYGNPKKFIGFTENIAKNVLEPEDIEYCKNIIAVEKLSAAVPLADSKFSRITNSMIVTTGGFYTRGISTIIQRFMQDKSVWLWTDGDVYGVYMREVIGLGSMNSRHLKDKIRNPNVVNAGLFPYVGKELNLPNDIDEKRPMAKPEARKRVELLKEIGFPDKDVKTFEANYTYELEALNIAFRDRNNTPVGQALYLTKLMELKNRDLKPMPNWTKESLQKQVLIDMGIQIRNKALNVITFDTDLKGVITEAVYEKVNELIDGVSSDRVLAVQKKLNLTPGEIRSLVCDWYIAHMEREVIPEDTISSNAFTVSVKGVPESVIYEKVNKFKAELKSMVKELLDELQLEVVVSPKDIPSSTSTATDMYKQAYRELKVKPADEQKMDSALRKYMS